MYFFHGRTTKATQLCISSMEERHKTTQLCISSIEERQKQPGYAFLPWKNDIKIPIGCISLSYFIKN